MAKNHSQGRRLVFSQAKILAKATLRERFSQIVLRAFPIYAVFSSSLLSLSSTKRLFFSLFHLFTLLFTATLSVTPLSFWNSPELNHFPLRRFSLLLLYCFSFTAAPLSPSILLHCLQSPTHSLSLTRSVFLQLHVQNCMYIREAWVKMFFNAETHASEFGLASTSTPQQLHYYFSSSRLFSSLRSSTFFHGKGKLNSTRFISWNDWSYATPYISS